MITAAVLALAVLGPVFFAAVSLRSTPESRGASPGAWVVVGLLLVLASAAAAALGGALVALARRVLRHLRGGGA
jgi:hypothetical protein